MSKDKYKKFNLIIPVLNGGDIFKENLKYIRSIAYLFDNVYISITYGAGYNEDKYNCLKSEIKNLVLLSFDEMSLVKNFDFIFSNVQESYLFILGHDDIPLDSGIRELQSLILYSPSHPCSCFGSNLWLNDKNGAFEHSILSSDKSMKKYDFIKNRIKNEFSLNQSGMVCHSSEVNRFRNLLITNQNSYWHDMMLITTPGVHTILESSKPVSKVGTHPAQLSRNIPDFEQYVQSGMWYHFIQSCYSRDFLSWKILISHFFLLASYISKPSVYKYTKLLLKDCILSWENSLKYFYTYLSVFYVLIRLSIYK